MNADHEEAVEFAKISKRENRVYVGNLSYDVKYRDLMEFMRGGGLGTISIFVSRIFLAISGMTWNGFKLCGHGQRSIGLGSRAGHLQCGAAFWFKAFGEVQACYRVCG